MELYLLQHEFKKLRNSVFSSGKKKRSVKHEGRLILWSHWEDAYCWDKQTNVIRIHHKLTEQHIFLDQSGKMRNKFANDCLDENMVWLMEVTNTFFFN